jgi:mannosyltransferase OCH1-like enzyme
MPKAYQRYIDSWKKYMPSYEIKRWDESNFDIFGNEFTSRAYKTGLMALVSDYVRLKILYTEGGVYLDTDVELIKPLDDILCRGGFMGFEKNSFSKGMLNVNIGLGAAVPPHHGFIKEALDFYDTLGGADIPTIVTVMTQILKRHGLTQSNTTTTIDGITFYPTDYFCPMEFLSTKVEITNNTRSIHHYSASWMTWRDKMKMRKGYYANMLRLLIARVWCKYRTNN